MNRNQVRPVAGMLTAIILIASVIGIYLIATSGEPAEESFMELSDEEKLERLDAMDEERRQNAAEERADLYGDASYCDRIDNQSLRERCEADNNTSTASPTEAASTTQGANTLEPLQNVSINDERRYNRAELYGDETYCDEITDDDLRAYCYDEVR